MKIYIVGTGGVGGYFGGLLARAGDVTFVSRGEQYHALKNSGLVIQSVKGDFTIKPVQVVDDIEKITNPDLILFTVKTYDTESAAEKLAKVVHKDTVILSFQNGVANDEHIMEYVKNAGVYPGLAYVGSTRIKPGVIRQTSGMRKLIFGDRKNPSNQRLKEIELIMRKADIDAVCSEDITRDIWKKYMFITAYSGVTAMTGSLIGEVLADRELRVLFERCVREVIAVAQATGVHVDDTAFDDVMKVALTTKPDAKSSLVVDLEKGRRTEIETLNGYVVRMAEKAGVDVPVNKRIYETVKQKTSR